MKPAGSRTPPTACRLTLDEALRSARDTHALLVAPGVLSETARIFVEQFPGANAVIVADEHTFPLGGESIGRALAAAGVRTRAPFIFTDPALYAEFRYVGQLETSLRAHDAIPIALGSGTVNDLVKLATHRTSRPGYLCVATAASMDGYTAYGASITCEGSKQTFNCPAPRAVVADIDIIRQAPALMTASGFADLSAKITAGADWILADALGVDPIDARAWAIVQDGLHDSLADPAGARAGAAAAITPLVEGLMLGGFAMQWARTSRPASGAEHQFSHLWDMEHHVHDGAAPSHGFKVGIATLAVTRLYEQFLAHDFTTLNADECVSQWRDPEATEAQVRRMFAGADFLDTAVRETRVKDIPPAELRVQLERLKGTWPEIRVRLRGQLLPSAEMKRRLDLVGAPTEPERIGISRERLRRSFFRAYHIRRRFTVLDAAVRTRTLERLLGGLFGPGAPWEIPAQPSRTSSVV